MQNSLKRDLKSNMDNFNLNFKKKVDTEISETEYDNDIFNKKTDDISSKKIHAMNTSLGDIIIELRNMFFIILELISINKSPLPFIFSTNKRKYVFSIFLIVFGCLLLLLSSLMMEKKVF
tara:strand:+ start:148 stop:507 length:360 start_codon:yes stop_codon:yes gene_type:complete